MNNKKSPPENQKHEPQKIKMEVIEIEDDPLFYKEENVESYPDGTSEIKRVRLESSTTKQESTFCNKTFTDDTSLECHIIKNHGNDRGGERKIEKEVEVEEEKATVFSDRKRFLCEQAKCTRGFKTKHQLEVHAKVHNSNKTLYACSYDACSKTFGSRQSLKEHYYSHREDSSIQTKISQKINNKSLKINSDNNISRFNNGEKPSSSSTCLSPSGKRVKNEGLNYNLEVDEIDCYVCVFPSCSRTFLTAQELEVHSKVHIVEKRVKCSYAGCPKFFKNISQMNVHIRSHSDEKPFKCLFKGCGKNFKAKSNLINHSRLHTNTTPFKCTHDGCHDEFKRKSYRDYHQITHSPASKPYKIVKGIIMCGYPGCDTKFKELNNSYHKHVHDHKLGKRFYCSFELCDASFYESKDLKNHNRVHTGERFFCGHTGCDRSYFSKQKLFAHERTHSGKIYVCSFDNCSKKFKSRELLSIHFNRHKKKKKDDKSTYQCSVCEGTFGEEQEFQGHVESCGRYIVDEVDQIKTESVCVDVKSEYGN